MEGITLDNDNSVKLERSWGDYMVDFNLHDEWLEILNRMQILELCNICEGHLARVDPLSRNALIIARVSDRYQVFFHQHWDELSKPVSDLIKACFNRNDARVCYSALREISLRPGEQYYPIPFDRIFLKVEKRHARQKLEFDKETVLWFEHTIAAFWIFDTNLSVYYERMGNPPIKKRKKQ
ncbi:MAG: hypothetical protein WCT05_08305 [Lentisphaeria bacterium]